MTTIAPDAAAWIRDNVLPRRLLERYGPMRCPCQYSICGGCAHGRHDRCLNGASRAGRPMRETSLLDRRMFVAAPVWRVGTACRYRCRCVCPPPAAPAVQEPASPRTRKPSRGRPLMFGQYGLFEVDA